MENIKNDIDLAVVNNSKQINIDLLKQLNKLYEIINKMFFNSELDNKVFITVYNDIDPKKRNQMGATSAKKIWNNNFNQISLKSVLFKGNVLEIIETLWHEMVHKLALQREIKDTEVNGRHNKEFKKLALEVGLGVTKPMSKNVGYGTELIMENYNKIDLSKIDIKFLEHFRETYRVLEKMPRPKKPRFKYHCVIDDYSFTISKKINIKCNECGVDLEIDEV